MIIAIRRGIKSKGKVTNMRTQLIARWSVMGALCGVVVAGWSVAAHGQGDRLENSPRHHEWVDIDAGNGRKIHTFVAYPEVSDPATTVLVIHENKGLTDWVRGVADQLAEAGYLALAPDLLSGTGPGGGNTDSYPSQDAATQGIYKLSADQVMADLDAVAAYAKSLEASNKKIAVAGFCWGGGQSFAYATHNPDLAAAFVFYGSGPRDEAAIAKIECPVYGFYGGNDARINGQIPTLEKQMKTAGKTYDPVIYDGAGHGFLRAGEASTDANDPNRKAHGEAWARWKEVLSHL
jgi:carboxymethylenebutenolidase